MRMRALTSFPVLAPLLAAGVIRVDDPKVCVSEPVRETVRPTARPFVVSTRMANALMAMTSKREEAKREEEKNPIRVRYEG